MECSRLIEYLQQTLRMKYDDVYQIASFVFCNVFIFIFVITIVCNMYLENYNTEELLYSVHTSITYYYNILNSTSTMSHIPFHLKNSVTLILLT